MNIRFWGDSALLVEVQDFHAAQRLREMLLARAFTGIRELVPGYRSLLIEADPLTADLAGIARRLPQLTQQSMFLPAPRQQEIEVHYDGEDLEAVARATGLAVQEVIRRHAAAHYTVAFLGFAPGFPYLVGLDAALRVPRLKTPRTHVPAGAVAIAGEFTGIYPQATPGGWRLLGHTDACLFNPALALPALLAPGDQVRFRACA